jgi:hypothetical protein
MWTDNIDAHAPSSCSPPSNKAYMCEDMMCEDMLCARLSRTYPQSRSIRACSSSGAEKTLRIGDRASYTSSWAAGHPLDPLLGCRALSSAAFASLDQLRHANQLSFKCQTQPEYTLSKGHLHLDAAIITTRSYHAGVCGIPRYGVAAGQMTEQPFDSSATVLVPDYNVSIFASTQDEALVGTPECAANHKVTARVA